MSNLPGNIYASRADYIELDSEPYALAQATLALAYEQRLANLIAWHGVIDAEDPVCEELYSAIYNGLGLKSL